MVDRLHYLLPAAFGAAGLSLYAYFEYKTWLKLKRPKNSDDERVEHKLLLNKAYSTSVLSQLKSIADGTETEIALDKQFDDDHTILSLNIKGRIENVKEAECFINRLIESSPDMTSVAIAVPKERLTNILDDYANNIHNLSQETQSKINLKCDPDVSTGSPFYIEIEGPTREVMLATDRVKQMVSRDPAMPLPNDTLDSLPLETSDLTSLEKSTADNPVVVIVSAVKSPNQFSLQYHALRKHLNTMERKIFQAVGAPNNDPLEVHEPEVGQFIAVPCKETEKYYRAMVMRCIRGPGPYDSKIQAKLVDYGYTEVVNCNEMRQLPEDFHGIPFFAMECSLGVVCPVNGEGWSEGDIEFFSKLTYKGKNILTAFKIGDSEFLEDGIFKNITLVTLKDPSQSGRSIAAELVNEGYAKWTDIPRLGDDDSTDSDNDDLGSDFDELY